MTEEWRTKAASMAQRAQEHFAAGEVELASSLIDSALELVDTQGSRRDVVFVACLLVAADLAAPADVESAASLYRTAADVSDDLVSDGAPTMDLNGLRGRAYLGLARADVERGYEERAQERYHIAREALQDAGAPDDVLQQASREAASTSRRPWWKFWN